MYIQSSSPGKPLNYLSPRLLSFLRQDRCHLPSRITFSQYLLGHASLERPPFFYAYAGMWLHLIGGGFLLLLFTGLPFFRITTSVIVGSFCLGIVIYGFVAREWGLFLNLGSYASSMGRLFYPEELSSLFLIIAILIAVASAYLLLSREYKRYNREVFDDQTGGHVPAWISIVMGMVVLLICIYGLNLL